MDDVERERLRRERYEAFLARSREYYDQYVARSKTPSRGVRFSRSRKRRYR